MFVNANATRDYDFNNGSPLLKPHHRIHTSVIVNLILFIADPYDDSKLKQITFYCSFLDIIIA